MDNSNKSVNRNGADTGRFAGNPQASQSGSSGMAGTNNDQGSNTDQSFNNNNNPDRGFRRLSRNEATQGDRDRDSSWGERDRNAYGRGSARVTDRGFGPVGYGGSGYRDPQRDSFDEQRMDDEGGAQDYGRGRGRVSEGPWQEDRYRSHDRSSYEQPYQPARGDRPRHERSWLSPKRWWQNEGATVADVMTRDIKTVRPEATIREVAEIMRTEDVGVVPIVGEDGRLVGLVTDRDLVVRGIAAGKSIDELRARDVATTDIEVASQRDALSDIIDLMGRQQIRRVPVIDDRDRLIGIVSLADIANRADQDEELQDAFEKISGRRSFWSRIWR